MLIETFDTDANVLLIAEIGNNHEGDFARAVDMIAAAADSGAHAVKFQTIRPDRLVRPSETIRLSKLQSFAFTDDQFRELADVAHRHDVQFLSTPFSLDAVDMLAPLVPAFKIASGDNDFFPLIDRAISHGKPIIVSMGFCDEADAKRIVTRIERSITDQQSTSCLALLHCVGAYPVPDDQANLKAITKLRSMFDYPIGYSDHTLGIDACVTAVALGACIVEKHFTLDKHLSDFRDHQLSATPDELRELSERIRLTRTMLGEGAPTLKRPACEVGNATSLRRSITAARDLPAGHIVSDSDIQWQRPATGLRPGSEADVIGKPLEAAVATGEDLTP